MTAVDTHPREQQLRHHQVLGELITAVPADIHVTSWAIAYNAIDATPGRSTDSDGERRETLRRIAETFGLEYDERDHGNGKNIVTAAGFVSGVSVRFWRLVNRCSCDCGKAARS